MKIFFAVLAAFCAFCMLAEPDENSRKNFAWNCATAVLGIVALYVMELVVLLA